MPVETDEDGEVVRSDLPDLLAESVEALERESRREVQTESEREETGEARQETSGEEPETSGEEPETSPLSSEGAE